MIFPSEMMELLHTAFPASSRANLRWADLETLKSLYRQNPDNGQVQEAQAELKAAGAQWDDEQIKDFFVNYLLETPYSTEMAEKSPDELRAALWAIYRYLFEEK